MDENQAVEDALEVLRAIAPEYSNDEVGLFAGAIEDYEKCKKHSDERLCLALMCICVGKQLIPFIK